MHDREIATIGPDGFIYLRAVIIEKGELGRHKTVLVYAPKQLPDVVKNLLLAP